MSDLKAEMHKIRFPLWGFAPEPAGGANSAPPNPLVVFKGLTSKGRARKEGGQGKGRKRGGEGKRRENGVTGRGQLPNILA